MPPLRSLRRWLILGNVLVALVVGGAAWVSLDNARQADEKAARLTAQNLAGSMSSEVSAEFRLIDNALETIADSFGTPRSRLRAASAHRSRCARRMAARFGLT